MALNQLDDFMNAISSLESGHNYNAVGPPTGKYGRALGRYQIMSKIWPAWAAEAGIPGADWRNPANQDRVARHKMTQYYNRYGRWDLVAVAWFAGAGTANKAERNGIASVGGLDDVLGTTVSKYVQRIMGTMGSGGGTQRGGRPYDHGYVGGPGGRRSDPFAGLSENDKRALKAMSDAGLSPDQIRSLSQVSPIPAMPGMMNSGEVSAVPTNGGATQPWWVEPRQYGYADNDGDDMGGGPIFLVQPPPFSPNVALTDPVGAERAQQQVGQQSLAAILDTISRAARQRGGKIIDIKELMRGLRAGEMEVRNADG